MNCYSAHLSVDVHCSLKQKKKKLYFIQPDLIVSIFYSFYQIQSFIHSHSHSLSFISHSSQAPLSQCRRYCQAHSGTVQLASFFFFFSFLFFHFIKSSLIHSLSFIVISHLKPLKFTLSTSLPSSSSLRSLKLTLSTSPARPSSTSPPSSSLDPRRRSASDALLFRRSTSSQLSLSSSCDALGF